MQRADVLLMLFIGILVVIVVDAKDDGAIAISSWIEVPQHVVPGARIAAGGPGAAKDVAGFSSPFVSQARQVSEARVAQRDDEIVAVDGLRLPLAAERHFEESGGG